MSDTEATKEELSKSRPRSRIWKLVQDQKLNKAAADEASVNLRFLLQPEALLEDPKHIGAVGGVKCRRTRLTGEPNAQRAEVSEDEEPVELQCGLALSAIGWRSVPATPDVSAAAVLPSSRA